MVKTSAIEQRGMGAGGKGPPARSIRSFLQLIEVAKTGDSGAKILFRHAEGSLQIEEICNGPFAMDVPQDQSS